MLSSYQCPAVILGLLLSCNTMSSHQQKSQQWTSHQLLREMQLLVGANTDKQVVGEHTQHSLH